MKLLLYLSGLIVAFHDAVWYSSSHFEDNYPNCGIRFVHKHCWHCICKACQIDIVFLLDFSEDVEPDCSVSDKKDLGIDLFNQIPTSYDGIKEQIDIVKDFVENIENEQVFENQNIRVGVAIFGQQEQAHEIVTLDHGLSREEFVCKLYKNWEDGSPPPYCSGTLEFEQKPLCHKPSVIETLQWLRGEDIFTTSDSILPADMKLRNNTLEVPTTRVLIASIADNFLTSNSDKLAQYEEEVNILHEQFEAVFTIAHNKTRTRLNELSYQNHLQTMACNGLGDQGRCGRVIQWEDHVTNYTGVGQMLAHSILDINSMYLPPSRFLLQSFDA
ncbi:Oidioi.mRNA.OKI2018_I69.chr2.g4265.t1.cds [Oikopleura dioica]|uniref:Oidioi.mRNA.OKI2018_I69.chr2.g4265.t1.cds n=1 Tax=Oikopleura dioica TaxID=34765 RepID=A0ABN7SWK1_OIKDI|nr:Oidioi.mRNA.OKI2018_I69.chr2.g4265.t1.cds [Oikopleura dioica]